jgi:hypothetical protein
MFSPLCFRQCVNKTQYLQSHQVREQWIEGRAAARGRALASQKSCVSVGEVGGSCGDGGELRLAGRAVDRWEGLSGENNFPSRFMKRTPVKSMQNARMRWFTPLKRPKNRSHSLREWTVVTLVGESGTQHVEQKNKQKNPN